MSSGALGEDDNYSSFTDTSRMSGRTRNKHELRQEAKHREQNVKLNAKRHVDNKTDQMNKIRPTNVANPYVIKLVKVGIFCWIPKCLTKELCWLTKVTGFFVLILTSLCFKFQKRDWWNKDPIFDLS